MKKIAITSIGLGLILTGANSIEASALEPITNETSISIQEERLVDASDVFSITKVTDILNIKPTRYEGNDSNHQSHGHNKLKSYKIDSTNANKNYTFANGNIKVSTDKENKGITIEVLDESINIEYVHMKGGNAFNCYDYNGDLLNGSGKDSGLYCPINKGESVPEISHITVYWTENEKPNVPPIEDDKEDIPMTPIEPSKPIEPPTEGEDNKEDNSNLPTEGEDDKEDIPMVPIEPSNPVEPPVLDGTENDDMTVTPEEPPVLDGTENDDMTVTPEEPPVLDGTENDDMTVTPEEPPVLDGTGNDDMTVVPEQPSEPVEPPTEGDKEDNSNPSTEDKNDKEDYSNPPTNNEDDTTKRDDSSNDNKNNFTDDKHTNSVLKDDSDINNNNKNNINDSSDNTNLSKDEIDNPKTGDTSLLPNFLGAISTISALFVTRKKKLF